MKHEEKKKEQLIEELKEALQRIADLEATVKAFKQSERDTQSEKLFLESMLDAVVDTVFVFDPDTGRPIRWNRAFNDISGYSDAEIASMRAPDAWYSPEDLEKSGREFDKLARGEKSIVEMALITKGNQRIDTEYTASLTQDEQGIPRYILAVGRDIRKGRQTRLALQKSRATARAILDGTPHMLAILDSKGIILDANKAIEKALGHSLDELKGHPMWRFHAPHLVQARQKAAQHVLQTGEILQVEDKNTDGTRIFETTLSPIRTEQGVTGVVVLVYDITEHKLTQMALRESLDFTETMLCAAPLGIATYRSDGQCVSANPAIPKMVGATLEQVLSQNFRKIESWRNSGLLDDVEQAMAYGVERRREIHVTSTFGKNVWFGCRVSRFFADGQPHLLLIIDDISELMQAAQNRQKLEAKIQQTQKLESLGLLAGGIAHDFNNLLVGIYGNMDLALLDLPESSPVHSYLADARTSALRATELISQMLAYAGKGKSSMEPLDLTELVREMTGLLKASLSKKKTIHHDLREDLPSIKADATQLRQVVMNLITNASDAIGEEAGEIAIRARALRCDRAFLDDLRPDEELAEGTYVCLNVSDTGDGMDEQCRSRIFDPFFTTKPQGRGLGLAAAHGIVHGHKGAIHLETKPGKGSTFTIYLPTVDGPSLQPKDSDKPWKNWHGRGTVLLVDDEEIVRRVGERMLQRLGFTVVTATNGTEAVDLFKEHDSVITAVLLDLNMPRMDGEETFHELQKLRNDVRVILSSGYGTEDASSRFAGKGLAGFLCKPFTIETLHEVLWKVLAGASPR